MDRYGGAQGGNAVRIETVPYVRHEPIGCQFSCCSENVVRLRNQAGLTTNRPASVCGTIIHVRLNPLGSSGALGAIRVGEKVMPDGGSPPLSPNTHPDACMVR
jgi:hypothetical protein